MSLTYLVVNTMSELTEKEIMQYLVDKEGVPFEEVALTYQQRKQLKQTAFCGPNKSYPAHDKRHVANAFARLSQFGGKLPRSTVSRIHGCLIRRAKRFGVEHKGCRWCKTEEVLQSVREWAFKKERRGELVG